jgi:RNA polymerase sigma-70 factor (ECF subfamily)
MRINRCRRISRFQPLVMDSGSFQKLALAEIDAVHRLAFHLCRDSHEAEDLVQETYLRAFRSVDGFALRPHGVRPWLFTILHNVLYSRRTRVRRQREVIRRRTFELMEGAGVDTSSPSRGVDAPASPAETGSGPAVDWDGLDERLCDAIRALPMAHRTVFLLSAVEDLKYREIADVVGVPIGTVMSRLSRARAALAAQLGNVAAEQGRSHVRRGRYRRKTPAPSPD